MSHRGTSVVIGAAICVLARVAAAQETDEPALRVPDIEIHGFASEGGFISTANDYIGDSSRGSLRLFEAGINVSSQLDERLRVGLQIFSRTQGDFRTEAPRLDWAYGDYRWQPWLGLRAGVIKMPFGLYNESVDIDQARLPILLPQSVYPIRNRDALLSHTGFALYGSRPLGAGGELDYQVWFGTLDIPENALELSGATLDEVDTRYVTGAQVYWHPPLDGLRIGGTVLQASIDFRLQLSAENIEALIAADLVPPDYDGRLRISQRPTTFLVGSAEYVAGDWLFAAEYSRWLKRQESSLPQVLPLLEEDAERFYVMATRRLSARFETGGYVSVTHADASDRTGQGMGFAEPFHAFQRDVAATLQLDVNEHWLWKAEAHLIDGTSELRAAANPDPARTWGLFLFKTTVSF